jgi:hypothetical protein
MRAASDSSLNRWMTASVKTPLFSSSEVMQRAVSIVPTWSVAKDLREKLMEERHLR